MTEFSFLVELSL